jgi:hypothetical protein
MNKRQRKKRAKRDYFNPGPRVEMIDPRIWWNNIYISNGKDDLFLYKLNGLTLTAEGEGPALETGPGNDKRDT